MKTLSPNQIAYLLPVTILAQLSEGERTMAITLGVLVLVTVSLIAFTI